MATLTPPTATARLLVPRIVPSVASAVPGATVIAVMPVKCSPQIARASQPPTSNRRPVVVRSAALAMATTEKTMLTTTEATT